MSLRTKLFSYLAFVLLFCSTNHRLAWSATDKTIVDLETSRPALSSRYHRPRGEQRYSYDKTEVDLAMPRSQPQATPEPQDTDRPTPRSATGTTPPTPPVETPLPGGGR